MLRTAPVLPLALAAALTAAAVSSAQESIAGVARRVHGEVLRYHAPLPGVKDALLVRSIDARRSIAWETAPVPERDPEPFVRFVWMFGLCVGADQHGYELQVDGSSWFRFENPRNTEVRDWTVDGPRGATLRFRATLVDRFDDLMGFCELRLPRDACTPGEAVTLSVVGESAGSQAWYTTFLEPIRERATLRASAALLRGEDGPFRVLDLDVVHLGEPVPVAVRTSFGETVTAMLEVGGNRIQLRHPPVDAPTEVVAEVEADGRVLHRAAGRIERVRPWFVDLIQHTHTDIGYTRPQTEILPEQVRFLDTALDLCDRTDDAPEDARFRWTCEVSWPVREFLRTRPRAQIERLVRRAREGRIEVTGLFLNSSDVVDEAGFVASLRPIVEIRAAGIPVTTAMQNDVNGVAWSLADRAARLGIEFVSMGQHGHRARIPFDVPTCFWWESPAGERVLAFRADHYHTGNFHGVHTGKLEVVEVGLLEYLGDLDARGYPFDRIAVQHGGYPTDNAPPSLASSQLVRAWNQKYVWPRLRCAIARDFLRAVKSGHGAELPVFRAAWPDWWSDGFGSAPRETAAARQTQERLTAIEALMAFERLVGLEVRDDLVAGADLAQDALLFYGEHTFGADESIRDPLSANSMLQWAEKGAYVWEAVKRTAGIEEGALGSLTATPARGGDGPQLMVFNALGHARSGVIELYADHETLPIDRPFRILDADGTALRVQLVRSRAEGSYWAIHVDGVPALGVQTFTVAVERGAEAEAPRRRADGLALEDEHFRVEVDPRTGAIASLVDRARGLELVDPEAATQIGQLIHERLGDREQLEAFTLDDYERTPLKDVAVDGIVTGPIWDALTLRGTLPGCDDVRCEIRLHHLDAQVELRFAIRKRRDFGPESIYVAFPFGVDGGEVVYDAAGGIVSPAGSGILPGAATDWQVMQDFVAARNGAGQVVLTSAEVPLLQPGGIRTGTFARTLEIDRPHVVSWVLNNYWTTNFVAASEGGLEFGYVLTASADRSNGFASRFGKGLRVPLLGRVVEPRAPIPASTLPALPPGMSLVSARPARTGDGVVLLLRELDGRRTDLDFGAMRFAGHTAVVSPINAIEHLLGPPATTFTVTPHASLTLQVK